ncbi:metallophosphoesterase family protein [Nitrospirillum pindoramense]|uniref:Calcineurin-like phosphoesterase family protein n=1 Tax=Nitrospirillum amazonense TaxID=28077 RepID=A0A560GXI0_9PROT|nr:metallophosphoesterase [Nitrospirillum amazonense]TWB38551.1 calcineurin-like phosphoesterase family protein [Nitrospirillum amazonense]
MIRPARLLALAGVCLPLSVANAAPTEAPPPGDPVVFHFATVGDSRQDPDDPRLTIHDAPFLQATRQLARINREVEAAHAQALIFLGDMVMGYSPDRSLLDRQYAYWRGMMAPLMEAGTYVLPVAGNHETESKVKQPNGKTLKLANPANEDSWRANMGDLLLDTALWQRLTGVPATHWSVDNAPASGTDRITSDQRQLTYSFDAGPVHIAVINTDPSGADGTAPVAWLEADLTAAQARGATHLYVFGHKMAYGYDFPVAKNGKAEKMEKETGLDAGDVGLRDAFWQTVERHHATYFCGHEHIFHAWQPTKAQGGQAWQVIIGSGGSPLAAVKAGGTQEVDRLFAWAEVWAYRSGRTHIAIHGFDEGDAPSRTLQEWDIPAQR